KRPRYSTRVDGPGQAGNESDPVDGAVGRRVRVVPVARTGTAVRGRRGGNLSSSLPGGVGGFPEAGGGVMLVAGGPREGFRPLSRVRRPPPSGAGTPR